MNALPPRFAVCKLDVPPAVERTSGWRGRASRSSR